MEERAVATAPAPGFDSVRLVAIQTESHFYMKSFPPAVRRPRPAIRGSETQDATQTGASLPDEPLRLAQDLGALLVILLGSDLLGLVLPEQFRQTLLLVRRDGGRRTLDGWEG